MYGWHVTAHRAPPLRLGRWPALAREAAAPAYAPAPAGGGGDPAMRLAGLDPAQLPALVDAALARLDGDSAALLTVADAVVTRLAGAALTAGDVALADSVAGLHRLNRRVTAEWHRRVAELDERAAWSVLRCRSTADWLASTLAMTTHEAATVVETARVLASLPQTAARFAAGELDAAQVQAAAKAHAELARLAALADTDDGHDPAGWQGENAEAARRNDVPPGADPAESGLDPDAGEDRSGEPDGDAGSGDDGGRGAAPGSPGAGFEGARAELDRLIAERTGGLNRAQTRATVAGWQHRIDERYGVEREQRAWRRRSGRLHVDEAEGTGHAHFDLDAVGIATVRAALEPLARKTTADEDRSYRQRMADAFVAVCQRALDQPDWLPETAGGRPQVLVVSTRETMEGRDSATPAYLDGVGPVSSATAQLLACDGAVTEVVVDAAGCPLQVKETGRATAAQRQAVIARDRGCIGCGAPVSRTQLHHLVFRRNHGATVVTNLVLCCWGCHRKIHYLGWKVVAEGGGYRLVAPWDPAAARGVAQPAHCGRQPG